MAQTPLDRALQLIKAGRAPIPIPYRSKAPVLPGWQHLKITAETASQYFNGAEQNLGVLLGEPSGWLVDVDIDCDEAHAAAPLLLPESACFGRQSTPRSHWLYTSENCKAKKFAAGGETLIEIRSTGQQTVWPPSVHPSGQVITPANRHKPVVIAAEELHRLVARVAAAALLGRHWVGARHDLTLSLAGALLHSGWSDQDVTAFLAATASAGEDSEPQDRQRATLETIARYRRGEATTGWPAVSEILPAEVVATVRKWLAISDMPNLKIGGRSVAGVATVAVASTENPIFTEPLPFTARIDSEHYPADALPPLVGAAVAEVQAFVQAPLPLVACSALSALSVAVQTQIDIKRADRLHGPVSLFLLPIADSGERKTTLDSLFTAAIREWEKNEAVLAEPAVRRHRADLAAWEEKRKALLELIRRDSRKGQDTSRREAELRDLEALRPAPPRVPRLLLGDETPESLAHRLAFGWPSAGIVSSEAGIVFGAHGMNRESIMRNLALLNVLWDGGSLSVGRRTSDSFTVRGARLTVGLQVQEATLREFFLQSRGLARGTGFLARFLIAWPASTQGSRPFCEPPPSWPALAAFNRRIGHLLALPPPLDENGALRPQLLELTPEARRAWIGYHDAVEAELQDGRDLADVKDVASKAADNAARLAALFHVFEAGAGAVSLPAFESAARIVAWHLSEARRFFGELALPMELADAARLDSWLLAHCRRLKITSLPRRDAQRLGPVRVKAALDAALLELEELQRARLVYDGRTRTIEINPALLAGGAP